MNKEFVTYEQALALKELGFDEPCLSAFFEDKIKRCDNIKNSTSDYLSAPLKQQVFRWFREKCGLHVNKTGNANYTSFNMTEPKIEVLSFVRYNDTKNHYEEAEDTCISKIIELVKLKR